MYGREVLEPSSCADMLLRHSHYFNMLKEVLLHSMLLTQKNQRRKIARTKLNRDLQGQWDPSYYEIT